MNAPIAVHCRYCDRRRARPGRDYCTGCSTQLAMHAELSAPPRAPLPATPSDSDESRLATA